MSNPLASAEARQAARQLVTCPKCSAVTEVIQHRRETIPCGECKTEMPLAESYADLVRERDAWQTLFYESEEENCSCNIVDTTKPVGDPYNYVCEWHEKNPRITEARKVVLTLAERAEAAESLNRQLVEAKNGAYAERDKMVAAMSKVWPSHLCRHPVEDKTWEDDWRWIVCIHAPTGQLTWHIHDSEREMFDHLEIKEQHWDGHSTEEKYVRLAAINSATPKQGEGKL